MLDAAACGAVPDGEVLADEAVAGGGAAAAAETGLVAALLVRRASVWLALVRAYCHNTTLVTETTALTY